MGSRDCKAGWVTSSSDSSSLSDCSSWGMSTSSSEAPIGFATILPAFFPCFLNLPIAWRRELRRTFPAQHARSPHAPHVHGNTALHSTAASQRAPSYQPTAHVPAGLVDTTRRLHRATALLPPSKTSATQQQAQCSPAENAAQAHTVHALQNPQQPPTPSIPPPKPLRKRHRPRRKSPAAAANRPQCPVEAALRHARQKAARTATIATHISRVPVVCGRGRRSIS